MDDYCATAHGTGSKMSTFTVTKCDIARPGQISLSNATLTCNP